MSEIITEYSSVILVNKSNEILLQLRDNNPRIADPNKLSLFAGGVEPGETKEIAAKRELYEETTLDLDDLEYLFTYTSDMERFGRVARSHVFLAVGIDESAIQVIEGQGYRKISKSTDLDLYDFALITKEILKRYFEMLQS